MAALHFGAMLAAVKVLVADDSRLVRMVVVQRLEVAGHSAVEASSVADAIGLAGQSFCCALLDLDLEDGDGTTIARQLRDAQPNLPIAFFSGTTDASRLDRATSFGPVFEKPQGIDELVAWAVTHRSGAPR